MSAHGYLFPIEDHVLTVRADGTFYRFQVTALQCHLVTSHSDSGHCCDRDVWRHLRLFIGHINNKVYTPKIVDIAVIEMYGDI
ncbi:RGS7 [Cordylochernes scorpioides]|uniref:RGS7 n=1 Tax=Cordylochernes scorpioides TaxID=51811 RepID=A0ABY6KNT3_9ARAC|nr:RGS7 [Cordylochernes scorpioides]